MTFCYVFGALLKLGAPLLHPNGIIRAPSALLQHFGALMLHCGALMLRLGALLLRIQIESQAPGTRSSNVMAVGVEVAVWKFLVRVIP